ncbi:Syndetin [Coccomyxa sp. Obi]|nr:Syndetin [Coccomyxa sp. Obi]
MMPVLEGYVYLGNVGSLGEEVMAAFAAVVGAAALKVARGVVLTRPTPGLEERVKSTQLLQELVKWVPADLFRTCLTRVLMVVFEILASHYHMSRWHEERIDQHTRDMEALHSAGTALRERIDALVQERAASPTSAESPIANERAGASAKGGGHFQEPAEDEDIDAEGSIAAVVERSLQRAVQSKAEGLPKAESTEQPSGTEADDTNADAAADETRDVSAPNAAESSNLAAKSSSVSLASLASKGADEEKGDQPSGADAEGDEESGARKTESPAVENGNDQPHVEQSATIVSTSSKVDDKGGGKGTKKKSPADAKALEIEYLEGELEALAEKEREEVLWGEALMQVEEGLNAGRRWLWDEASRKVGMLLAAPAAFQGENFLQVLEWTQTMLEAGEAFCGSQSATLRDALKRQSGRFFAAYHSANLQALHSMLEREVWKQLPMIPGGLPSIRGALTSPSPNAAFPFDTSNFGAWVSHGNPWRSQAYEDEDEEAEGQRTPGQASEGGPGNAGANPASEAAAAAGNGEEATRPQEAVAPPAADDAVARSTSSASTSGKGTAEAVPPMTTSSLRLAKWLAEYAALMRLIGSEAGRVWSGMAELFELYFLHTFHTFGDITILELTSPQVQRQGGADIVPVRLKNAVLRILGRSKYRQYYLQQTPGAAGTPGAGNAPGGAASPGGPSQGAVAQYSGITPTKDYSPFGRLPSAAQPVAMSPQSTAFSHPGNMYGLMERKVAVDSLRSVAGLLSDAYSALHDSVFGRTDVPENHTLDTFFSTVKATADLRDMVLRAAARYNLPIRWLPDRLAEQNFNIEEPPTRASPWVKVLMGHAAKLRQSLDASPGLTPANIEELWRHAMHFTAEVVLEGIAKAGAKGKCTAMGRAAMSLDLQAVQKGLAELAGPGGAEAAADSLRMVDTYIKAFYLPWGEELRRWAQTHPEYTRDQIMMLTVCIAEANGLKRKERNAFLSQLEADLSDLRAVP